MYVYYPHWYSRLPLGPWVLYEDDVNLSPEFEGNIVKSHANTFLCRDCLVFITIIIIILYSRCIYILVLYILLYTRYTRRRRNIAVVAAVCGYQRSTYLAALGVWITLSQNVLEEKNTVSHLCNSNNMYTHITSERLVLYRHSSWI